MFAADPYLENLFAYLGSTFQHFASSNYKTVQIVGLNLQWKWNYFVDNNCFFIYLLLELFIVLYEYIIVLW